MTTPEWHKWALNPERIDSIYGRSVQLNRARLSKLQLYDDGPRMELHFHITDLPETMPHKWASQGVNTICIVLALFPIDDLKIEGWSTANSVSFYWNDMQEHRKSVVVMSERIKISVTFESLHISDVRGFRSERD
jgi:hypothetical protein